MACPQNHRELGKDDRIKFCPSCGLPIERTLAEENTDYVTTLACINPQRAIVAVMHYNKAEDSYSPKKCSEPLSLRGAAALAESWAAALHLEVR